MCSPCFARTDDGLSVVLKGCQDAVDSIKTYKGSITAHYWRLHAGGDIVEMESSCTIAYVNGKYKLSEEARGIRNDIVPKLKNVIIGDKLGVTILAFDGSNFTNTISGSKYAKVCSAADNSPASRRNSSMKERIDIIGHGIFKIEPCEYGKLKVVGRRQLNGDECIIVEKRIERPISSSRTSFTTYEYWVNPAKGYTIPIMKCWTAATGIMDKSLLEDIITEIKDYGNGTWGPSKSTLTQYNLYGTDKGKEHLRMEVTYGPDFRINVPVSSDEVMLKLDPGTSVWNETTDETYSVL